MKFPEHKCGLFLTHNEHRDYYQPLSQWIEEHSQDGDEPWGSPEQKQKCLDTDELWELHWYPNTPVGFLVVWAATLEELLTFANEPR